MIDLSKFKGMTIENMELIKHTEWVEYEELMIIFTDGVKLIIESGARSDSELAIELQ